MGKFRLAGAIGADFGTAALEKYYKTTLSINTKY